MTRCPAHAKGEPVRIEAGLESFHVIRLIELHDMRVFFLPRLRPRYRRVCSQHAGRLRGVAKMARFHCRTCGKEGTCTYDAERYTCPLCDSIDVQFVIGIDEFPEDDPMRRFAEEEARKKKNED
jgi:hypothetical protein